MNDQRKPPPRAMGQLLADAPDKTGPTIVGGQPPAESGTRKRIPVGLERVLYLAATDSEFREILLLRRDGAARERGLALRPSEEMMLRSVPEAQLRASIDGIDTSEGNLERRGFLRAVAATAVTIAAGEALLACGDDTGDKEKPGFDSGGIRPDGLVDDAPMVGGIRPDSGPTVDIDVDSTSPVDGIRPDALQSGGIRPG